jgi:hypothetical protein
LSEDTSGPGLSHDEETALSSVLDQIIPPSDDGRLPGAGELGLARHIVQMMQRAPDLGPVIASGLSVVDDLAGRRGARGFAALPKPDKLEVLNELATTEPAFLPGLIFHTYVGYYQNPRVVEALGLEPRPPHPKGYELEPIDLTLLDGVRQRPA